MKKLLSIILTMFMLVSNTCAVFANESAELYAYTTDTTGFDTYAQEDLSVHIYTYYGYIDDTLELGKGINVFGDVTYPMVVYPIWKNNDIVATFKVSFIDGQYSGSYSEGNVEQLNHAREIATVDKPVRLVKTANEFIYVVDGITYDLTSGTGKVLEGIDVSTTLSDNATTSNVANAIEYVKKVNSRAATSWYLSWNPTEHNGDSVIYCYAYSLSPILRGLGYSTYTVSKITTDIKNQTGSLQPGIAFSTLRTYLTNQGFTYQSSSTGYMSTTNVVSWIYDNRMYVMIGLSVLTESSTPKHFGVITGYSSSSGSYTYQVYDPQHNGINGKCTMSASTRKFTNSDGSQFSWDSGYVTNFQK